MSLGIFAGDCNKSHFSFDTGRVLAQRAIDIHTEQTREELTDAMAATGAELMLEVIENLDRYWESALEQDDKLVTYGKLGFIWMGCHYQLGLFIHIVKLILISAPKIDKAMFEIDWHELSAMEVYNRWRALTGLRGKIHSIWEGESFYFLSTSSLLLHHFRFFISESVALKYL